MVGFDETFQTNVRDYIKASSNNIEPQNTRDDGWIIKVCEFNYVEAAPDEHARIYCSNFWNFFSVLMKSGLCWLGNVSDNDQRVLSTRRSR